MTPISMALTCRVEEPSTASKPDISPSLDRRVFRILRQIVGDLEPRRLTADEDVACRPHRWIVVKNGLPINVYATAICKVVGPSPSSVVRRMSRISLVSL